MYTPFNPEHLAAMLRGTPVAKTLTAPPPEPQHRLPLAVARWHADQAQREAEALARATTPTRAWIDGAMWSPTESPAPQAQEAAAAADQVEVEGVVTSAPASASEPQGE